MQASLSSLDSHDVVGSWTDLENGRTDRTVWNLPGTVQDSYYPLMDRFYSITNVEQDVLSDEEEEYASSLRQVFPVLSLYSRYTCARAVLHTVAEVHTLVAELLDEQVISYLSRQNIRVVKPSADIEKSYADPLLEERYQTALETFRLFHVNPPAVLADSRALADGVLLR